MENSKCECFVADWQLFGTGLICFFFFFFFFLKNSIIATPSAYGGRYAGWSHLIENPFKEVGREIDLANAVRKPNYKVASDLNHWLDAVHLLNGVLSERDTR